MNKILRRLYVSDANKKSACSQSLLASSGVSVVIVPTKLCYLPTKQREESCFRGKSTKISARSLRSRAMIYAFLSRVSGFLVCINRHEQDILRVLQTQGHVYRQTMWFTNKILRRMPKYTKFGSLTIIYSFFLEFLVFWSVWKICFRRKSTKISARSLRSLAVISGYISRVSGFLVGIMNKTISRVLRTHGHNCTDKQWFINKILRRIIVCFQRKYKQIWLARFL